MPTNSNTSVPAPQTTRNLLIVELRDKEDYSFNQISRIYGFSPQRARTIYNTWKDRYYSTNQS